MTVPFLLFWKETPFVQMTLTGLVQTSSFLVRAKWYHHWCWLGFWSELVLLRWVRRIVGVARWVHLVAMRIPYFRFFGLSSSDCLINLVLFCWSCYLDFSGFRKYHRLFVREPVRHLVFWRRSVGDVHLPAPNFLSGLHLAMKQRARGPAKG